MTCWYYSTVLALQATELASDLVAFVLQCFDGHIVSVAQELLVPTERLFKASKASPAMGRIGAVGNAVKIKQLLTLALGIKNNFG